ncbi:MAG: diphosphomevalonate decarboxylase [Myxococcales bacterium]|nr:diphosphomevalonate decarboxylase [Myxococcales bacterium]MCB9733983.1 diphosphomevalonate decarboxylase [Deltaproteobacteria bacterium]
MTDLVLDGFVAARAHVNIALVKYWGKAPAKTRDELNLPAVPSLSLTLSGLYTDTRVRFAPDAREDRIVLDGKPLGAKQLAQAQPILDAVRARAGIASRFAIESDNHVPTAAGLASSASGMAALAAATARCAGLEPTPADLSALARLGSGSASRSIFGGWAAWDGPSARAVAPPEHWDVAVVVAVVNAGPKPIGSRDAMTRTARTSPYYHGWVASARELFHEAEAAVLARDFDRLVAAMELSTLRMHAVAMAASPPILYWEPVSLAVLREVERMRRDDGLACGYTLDAGPNVKVFCRSADVTRVAERLTSIAGVDHTISSGPGQGVTVRVEAEETS